MVCICFCVCRYIVFVNNAGCEELWLRLADLQIPLVVAMGDGERCFGRIASRRRAAGALGALGGVLPKELKSLGEVGELGHAGAGAVLGPFLVMGGSVKNGGQEVIRVNRRLKKLTRLT